MYIDIFWFITTVNIIWAICLAYQLEKMRNKEVGK